MDRSDLARWVGAYEAAWRAAGTASLAALFTEDAEYLTGPFVPPVAGLPAIRLLWEAERSPGEAFSMTSQVVAVEGDTGVVRVEVAYSRPRKQLYRDLWVIRLAPDGRCRRFEEWPFWPPGTGGVVAGEDAGTL